MRRSLLVATSLGFRHRCPVCRTPLRRFVQVHPDDLPGARCPRCDALQRHRHLWLFLDRETQIGGRVLHVAPESGL
jgi:hypothetical protein